jgi:hypothetical protein
MNGHGTASLVTALSAGQHGMAISLESAEKRDPEFKAKAQTAILSHLKAVGQASGEDLTDVARAHGAVPPDSRAFGGIFQALARKGLIRCLRSDLPRRNGHGTSGGRLWALGDACYFSSDEASELGRAMEGCVA